MSEPKCLTNQENVEKRIERINEALRTYREDHNSRRQLIQYREAMVDAIPNGWNAHYMRAGLNEEGILLSARKLVYANDGRHIYVVLNFARPSRPVSVLAEKDDISEKIPDLPTPKINLALNEVEKMLTDAKKVVDNEGVEQSKAA